MAHRGPGEGHGMLADGAPFGHAITNPLGRSPGYDTVLIVRFFKAYSGPPPSTRHALRRLSDRLPNSGTGQLTLVRTDLEKQLGDRPPKSRAYLGTHHQTRDRPKASRAAHSSSSFYLPPFESRIPSTTPSKPLMPFDPFMRRQQSLAMGQAPDRHRNSMTTAYDLRTQAFLRN